AAARKTLVVVSEDLPRVDRRRGFEALPTTDTVTRSAARHNVSIYAVDPRLPSADAAETAPDDVLRILSASSDGRAVGRAGRPGARREAIGAVQGGGESVRLGRHRAF